VNVFFSPQAVLLLGYKEPLETMFRNANPGLTRRFDCSNPVVFEDFTDEELLLILGDALRKKNVSATYEASMAALDRLTAKRRLPNFGNAGEVQNMVNGALTKFFARARSGANEQQLLPEDFEQASDKPVETIDEIFRSMLGGGCAEIKRRLRATHTLVASKKARGMDYTRSTNLNYLIVGSPGSGKTSTSGLLGRVFYSMGLLASPDVVTVSAAKLQAPFVGQTAELVRETFRSAIGKVLLIDEAHRLDPRQSPHSFMKEAVDEMVNILTEDAFRGKMVVVLAGYTKEMRQMLRANQGLTSRFPDEFVLPVFTLEDSLQLLHSALAEQRYTVDLEVHHDPHVRNLMSQVVGLETFASGRDVHAIASRIELLLVDVAAGQHVTPEVVVRALRATLADMRARIFNEDEDEDEDEEKSAGSNPKKKKQKRTSKSQPVPLFAYDTAIEVTRTIDTSTTVNVEAKSDSEDDDGEDDDDDDDLASLPMEQVQEKLQAMGACGGGYGWTRVDKGWVCEANVCRVTDDQFRAGKL